MANQDDYEDPNTVQVPKDLGVLNVSKAGPVPEAPQLAVGGRRKTAIRYFGDYVLLGEIGRGGMGVIYRALQVSLDREVAIKMIYAGKWASESSFRRFQTEAEAMAKLDHSNIVSIYEVGEHQGQHYLSMKLIDGASLAERMEEFALGGAKSRKAAPGAEAVRSADSKSENRRRQHGIATLVASVAQAIHYAHQRGVLHRDLKPSNILVDSRNEPHVSDFGLARLLNREQRHTQTEAVMGTPSYMSPEQAAGRAKDVTVATDVFSLGAILYELLTGQAPFTGESEVAIIQKVRSEDPIRPLTVNPLVDRDLETICLKCLEKEPGKRYATAEKLSAELQRYLRGEPIQARPVTRVERAWRLCRRHPAIAGLTTALILALVTGATGFFYQWHRVLRETDNLQRAKQETDKINQKLQDVEEELRTLRIKADKGDAAAQRTLGVMYLEGAHLGQNEGGAALWFRRAASQGDAEAQYQLGQLYEHGRGVPQDQTEALEWYRKAAQQGLATAQDAEKALEERMLAGLPEPSPTNSAPTNGATGALDRFVASQPRPAPQVADFRPATSQATQLVSLSAGTNSRLAAREAAPKHPVTLFGGYLRWLRPLRIPPQRRLSFQLLGSGPRPG